MITNESSFTRVNKRENPFAQINRKLINDVRLSPEARLMLIWLLDKPDGWEITIDSLANQLPAESAVVMRMIGEACRVGYVEQEEDNEGGQIVHSYHLSQECYGDPFPDTTYETYATPKDKPKQIAPGYIYLLNAPDANTYKIGKAKELTIRVKELSVKSPFVINLIHAHAVADMASAEVAWHKRFADKRSTGEWFGLTEEEVKEFVEGGEVAR